VAPLAGSAARRLLTSEQEGNCRLGHAGVVCGECVETWTLQGQFCAPCPANSALSSIPRARLAGYIVLAIVIFCGVSLPFLLGPLLQPRELLARLVSFELKTSASFGAGVAKLGSASERIFAVAAFCRVPLRLVAENLQIISSFKRTMRLAWPRVFNSLVQRLSFLCAPARLRACRILTRPHSRRTVTSTSSASAPPPAPRPAPAPTPCSTA